MHHQKPLLLVERKAQELNMVKGVDAQQPEMLPLPVQLHPPWKPKSGLKQRISQWQMQTVKWTLTYVRTGTNIAVKLQLCHVMLEKNQVIQKQM